MVEGKYGDRTNSAVTLTYGLTVNTRRSLVQANPQWLHEDDVTIIRGYLDTMYTLWSVKAGYSVAPLVVQEVLLDASYNLGHSVMEYPKLTHNLASGSYIDVVRELLDSADIDDYMVLGLGKRRALSYNKVASILNRELIKYVKLDNDGTMTYLNALSVPIFKYGSGNNVHAESSIGTLTITME